MCGRVFSSWEQVAQKTLITVSCVVAIKNLLVGALRTIISEKLKVLNVTMMPTMGTWNVEQIAFDCEATSDPSVTLMYTWKHNNVTVDVRRPEWVKIVMLSAYHHQYVALWLYSLKRVKTKLCGEGPLSSATVRSDGDRILVHVNSLRNRRLQNANLTSRPPPTCWTMRYTDRDISWDVIKWRVWLGTNCSV